MIGAGVAGGIVSFAGVKAGSIGISGLPAFLSVFTEYWGVYFLAMGTSIAITVVLTLVFSKMKIFEKQLQEE